MSSNQKIDRLVAADGEQEVVTYLVNNGLDVNAMDGDGNLAIKVAAKYGGFAVAKYLLGNGAENLPDNIGERH